MSKEPENEPSSELESLREQLAQAQARTDELDAVNAEFVRSQELTRRLIEAMPGGVVHVAADGAIQTANAEALRILGLSYDELTDKYTVDFETETIYEDGRPCPVAEYPVTQALVTGEPQAPATIGVRNPDGKVSWAIFTAVPVRGADGTTTGAVVTFLDITARKQLESELRRSQKLEGIGRLAGGVAHDFNNLLTVILGNTQILRESMDHGEIRPEDVEQIRHAAQHAGSLTRQLLSFAAKDIPTTSVLALDDLVRRTTEMLRRIIGEDIELGVAHDVGVWPVRIDPGQFEQVLINLCVNARDAMPEGGTLSIEIRNETSSNGDEQVILSVADTGVGMAEEELERAFDPFFTTKPPGSGTGLGLSTCYGIVKQAGGGIEVRSSPGNGTSFRITLPRAIGEETETAPRDTSATNHQTVLVIEDEPLVRRMVERTLARAGYTVLAARSGNDALSMCERHEGKIHLVLTDVVMPRMSGPEVAQRILDQRPEVRVLYMSGYADDALDGRGLERGDVAFLRKPFQPDELTDKMRDVLSAAN
jgi:PAS domain S-box-containing protein